MKEISREEKILVERAVSGDRAAFDALVRACAVKLFNFALRLTAGNRDAAEDITQDAFVSAYGGISRFKGESPFLSWMYKITLNTWKNRVRYEKRRFFSKHSSLDERFEAQEGSVGLDIEDKAPGPDIQLERDYHKEKINKALEALGEQAKEIIILREVEGMSYEELAGMLGISMGTVKSRVARAREALKNEMQKLLKDK